MVGGLEQMSYALAKEFQRNVDTTLIAWGKSQKYLPIFLPYAFLKALYLIPRRKITHLHLGDGLLSPFGLLLKKIFGIKTSITIAGLDITFDFPGYQMIVPKCVASMDKIVCISNATLEECLKRGVPREKCVVIPCGVYPEDWLMKAERKDLELITHMSLQNKKILITVGRLVKRKGVYWFIEHVLSKLGNEYIYFIIGSGPEKERINALIRKLQLGDRVKLLGKIPNEDLKVVYNTADLFIMPNIKVDNNVEGFGIVAVEASSTGLPIIGSDMEGISDAVIQNKTGILTNSGDTASFIKLIKQNKNFKRSQVSRMVKEYYSWENVGKSYMKFLS